MSAMYFGYYFGKLSIAVTEGERPEKGDWETIDESTLSTTQQALLKEYRAAYHMAKEAKAVFEASVRRDAGFAKQPEKPKAPAKAKLSLAEFLEQRKQNGQAI